MGSKRATICARRFPAGEQTFSRQDGHRQAASSRMRATLVAPKMRDGIADRDQIVGRHEDGHGGRVFAFRLQHKTDSRFVAILALESRYKGPNGSPLLLAALKHNATAQGGASSVRLRRDLDGRRPLVLSEDLVIFRLSEHPNKLPVGAESGGFQRDASPKGYRGGRMATVAHSAEVARRLSLSSLCVTRHGKLPPRRHEELPPSSSS